MQRGQYMMYDQFDTQRHQQPSPSPRNPILQMYNIPNHLIIRPEHLGMKKEIVFVDEKHSEPYWRLAMVRVPGHKGCINSNDC